MSNETTHEEGLKKWRADRPSLEANYRVYFQNIIEEILEPLYSKENVKIFTKEIVERYYPELVVTSSRDAIIDAICDTQVFSINEIELMGFDNNKCMQETVKEISSRKQDPLQKDFWQIWGYDGTKWQKDPKQDTSTLYKANYSFKQCRR